jgi:hypothetical protein
MNQRFIIGHKASLQDIRTISSDIYAIDLIKNKSILVISDIVWWTANATDIVKWCDSCLTKWSQHGMLIGFINDEERNLFLMRWA